MKIRDFQDAENAKHFHACMESDAYGVGAELCSSIAKQIKTKKTK